MVAFRKNCTAAAKNNRNNCLETITFLNTSYNLLIDLTGKYIGEYTMENGIWDEGQLGAVAGVLGIVDLFYNGRSEDITTICL